MAKGKWKIEGYNTRLAEEYAIPGQYKSDKDAREAARKQLKKLEKEQPSSETGGQAGTQDHVYIVSPDGEKERFTGD